MSVLLAIGIRVALAHGADPDLRCPAFADPDTVFIAGVDDGDTLRLADGRSVRLIGINAPELGNRGDADQPLARQAEDAVRRFLPAGSRAGLLLDKSHRDRYGRTLAHLYDEHGRSLEVFLLARGLAWHLAIPPNLRLAACLNAVEQQARKQRLGIWSDTGIAAVAATAVDSGGYQRVRGRVERVALGRAWWINFDGDIAGVIYPEHQHRFNAERLRDLEGRQVEIQGWVYPSGSNRYSTWRMQVQTPYGLEVLQ